MCLPLFEADPLGSGARYCGYRSQIRGDPATAAMFVGARNPSRVLAVATHTHTHTHTRTHTHTHTHTHSRACVLAVARRRCDIASQRCARSREVERE